MLAGVASGGAAASPAPGSELPTKNAAELGPSLVRCGRSKRRRAAMAAAASPSSSSNSIKIGTLKELKHQDYPISFTIYHNVQEGDTLTSIARQYNTPLRTIAEANKIEDIDVLQAGQVLLVPVNPKTFQQISALVLKESPQEQQPREPELIFNAVVQPQAPAATSPKLQSFVRFTVPLLLLAPVIVFCFRKLVEATQNHIKLEVSRTQAEKEVRDAQHRPRLKRWQGILEGDRETDAAEGQLQATVSCSCTTYESKFIASLSDQQEQAEETEEERKKREEDELRESYVELEARYIKFLADSGLSKSGYWRGGIPSSG